MRKIIFCLLLFNVLFFTFIKFTFADVVNLGKLPSCRFVDGTTNCKNGSYYYIDSVPASGTKIMSTGRVVDIISFQGSGYFDLFDKSGNLIERLDVNSPDRVSVYVFPKRVYSYTYFGVDLIATHFRQDGGNLGIVVAYKPYSLDLHNFLRGGYVTPEQLPKPEEPKPESKPESEPECDICSKIDSILEELKGNDCDVCSKLSGILEDTNKINNNISQLKITTGYINSHVSDIKDKLSDSSKILAKMRQTLDTIRMQDLDRNDSLDSIDNKLDNLESIDNNLVSIKDEVSNFVENYDKNNDFSDFEFPDLPSGDLYFPDFDSGDLEKKAPELSNDFEPLDFDEYSDVKNFNTIPEADDWTTVDGQAVKPYGAIKPDNIIKPDGVITPDSVIKPDNIIKPDGVITPDSVIKPDNIIKPDGVIKSDG